MCFNFRMNNTRQKWLAQLRKGYLELCVMLLLDQLGAAYGLALLRRFTDIGLEVNEGTLYPLLNRMHKNGWIDSYWETPAEGGHPRRFYCLSDHGKSLLPGMIEACRIQTNALNSLMGSS